MSKWWSIGVLLIVVASLATGCDDGNGNNNDDPVLIGTITSQDGHLGEYGQGWAKAVRLAVNEANSAGGILGGRRVELIVENDSSNELQAGVVAQSLVEQGVVGIIGAPGSGSSLAAIEVTEPAMIPQISGASTSPDLNSTNEDDVDDHPYFFRTVPNDLFQGVVIADLAHGEYNEGNDDIDFACTNLAVVYADSAYGIPFAEAIESRFQRLGGTIAASIGFAEDAANYNDVVDDLLDAAPECIALIAYSVQGGLIVRRWFNEGGAAIPWFGTDGLKGRELMEEIGSTASDVFYGTAPSNDQSSPQYTNFSEAYSTTFGGETPVVFAHNMYDAAALLVLAIVDADSTNGADIRDSLFTVSSRESGDQSALPGELVNAIGLLQNGTGVDFVGAGGPVDFLPNGDVISDYEIWHWNGSSFDTAGEVRGEDIDVD
jgi:branched-chain amino acid transport system substrate-binding protein